MLLPYSPRVWCYLIYEQQVVVDCEKRRKRICGNSPERRHEETFFLYDTTYRGGQKSYIFPRVKILIKALPQQQIGDDEN